MKKRYKIRKEQLERVVENFVMESKSQTKKKITENEELSEEEMNEFFGRKENRKEKLKKDYGIKSVLFTRKGFISKPTSEEESKFWSDAEADDYQGSVGHKNGKIAYKPADDSNWSTGGHQFGGGA